MDTEGSGISPPFGPPDVPWEAVKLRSPLPEGAIECGLQNGHKVYIGRTYHNGELLVGSALVDLGLCYVIQDGKLHESTEYEIVTVPVGDPLIWELTSGSNISRNALTAGKSKDDEVLYVGRHVEGQDTFVGWVHPGRGTLTVAEHGVEKTYTDYELLVHQFLDRLCICPPCPPHRRL